MGRRTIAERLAEEMGGEGMNYKHFHKVKEHSVAGYGDGKKEGYIFDDGSEIVDYGIVWKVEK